MTIDPKGFRVVYGKEPRMLLMEEPDAPTRVTLKTTFMMSMKSSNNCFY